jgi:SAM-dependent methyltransferase
VTDEAAFHVNPTTRFSGRVEAYRRYRSRYSREIIPLLEERCDLKRESVIADIGAGTGMLAELFLENGNSVFAVEPNAEMRAACQELAPIYPRLTCIDGAAGESGLPDHSVDFVTAGRALHWFDQINARREFLRILRTDGWVVLASLGPRRRPEAVNREYQTILREHGLDYARLRDRYDADSSASRLFASCEFQKIEFTERKEMTYEELEGHALSLSVTPQPSDPRFPAMQEALRGYFARHESGGKMQMPMNCTIHFGHLR